MISVRYFAAAAEAAGRDAEQLSSTSLGELKRHLVEVRGEELARVLDYCTLLVDGKRVDDEELVAAGATVDVLPPFAGG